jgi:hypothetical protein
MARSVQHFTRLHPDKVEVLKVIGQEMIDTGAANPDSLRNHQGEINTSEVTRRLLAKADARLA